MSSELAHDVSIVTGTFISIFFIQDNDFKPHWTHIASLSLVG